MPPIASAPDDQGDAGDGASANDSDDEDDSSSSGAVDEQDEVKSEIVEFQCHDDNTFNTRHKKCLD